MARKEKDHNPFHGFWVITRTQQKCTDNKWATLRRFHFWDYTWLFHQNQKTDYRPADCFYNGEIKEMCAGSKTCDVEYSYFTPVSHLYLNYPDHSDDGFMWTCHSSSYFVATPDKNTLILYDLEDVGMAPDDYCFRIILKKGCLRNRLIEDMKGIFLPARSYYKAGSLL